MLLRASLQGVSFEDPPVERRASNLLLVSCAVLLHQEIATGTLSLGTPSRQSNFPSGATVTLVLPCPPFRQPWNPRPGQYDDTHPRSKLRSFHHHPFVVKLRAVASGAGFVSRCGSVFAASPQRAALARDPHLELFRYRCRTVRRKLDLRERTLSSGLPYYTSQCNYHRNRVPHSRCRHLTAPALDLSPGAPFPRFFPQLSVAPGTVTWSGYRASRPSLWSPAAPSRGPRNGVEQRQMPRPQRPRHQPRCPP